MNLWLKAITKEVRSMITDLKDKEANVFRPMIPQLMSVVDSCCITGLTPMGMIYGPHLDLEAIAIMAIITNRGDSRLGTLQEWPVFDADIPEAIGQPEGWHILCDNMKKEEGWPVCCNIIMARQYQKDRYVSLKNYVEVCRGKGTPLLVTLAYSNNKVAGGINFVLALPPTVDTQISRMAGGLQ